MSEARNPGELTRVPRAPSSGTLPDIERPGEEDIPPEQALAEAKEAQRRAEQDAAAARTQAQAAARERDEARGRAQAATGDALTSRERSILAGIEAATIAADQAEQAMVVANAAGDSTAFVKASRALSAAQIDLGRLNDQKSWFDGERERLKNHPPPQQQPQQPAGTISINTPGGVLYADVGVQSWIKQHPRFTSDATHYNLALKAHHEALEAGAVQGSPIYFQKLTDAVAKYEKFEAYESGELQREEPRVQTRQQRQSPTTIGAPVSRETSAPRPSGTPDERSLLEWINRSTGGSATTADMREFARVNGYRGEAGYRLYLQEQAAIREQERNGDPTGLVVDRTYR